MHRWDIGSSQAVQLQKELAGRIILKDCFEPIRQVAGVDVKVSKDGHLFCAVLIFSYPQLKIVEKKAARAKAAFPYIPGLLSFREGPAVLECFGKVENRPNLVFFDGNGIMHPRRLGLASHMGLLLNLPSIGVAKSRLLGSFKEPESRKGCYTLVEDRGQVIGAALRTREGVKPVFVSCGHKVCLDSAIKLTLKLSKYRVCEPTRQAHNYLASTF